METNQGEEVDTAKLTTFNAHLVEDLKLLTPNDKGFIDSYFTERLRNIQPDTFATLQAEKFKRD